MNRVKCYVVTVAMSTQVDIPKQPPTASSSVSLLHLCR